MSDHPPRSADDWERISDLFATALDLEGEARVRFLNEIESADAPAAAEVRSLLAAHEQDGVVDEVPQDLMAEALAKLPPEQRLEERVGAFKVVRTLGTGGMGAVFLGERIDADFRQQVALKLVRRGFDSPELRDRFLRERRILARLEHPNVARLVDGGVTDEGVPYFAMEFVDGVPLHAYTDDRRLTIEDRLQLFLQVCAGVEHAHRQLVVHRDLKPANVFVTGDGNVKLLDFGVAKLLEAEEAQELTRRTQRWLTPEYASPEQIRGEPATTACDVYALGVLLYELLTGHRPYGLARVAPHEINSVILERQPERPSTAVSKTETLVTGDGETRQVSPAEVASARQLAPDRLRRRLAGDLDTIVLKAMHKDPSRRYGTVAQLAEDIENHLVGRPVSAQRDSWAYRTSRFLKRNRVPVGLGTAAALALLMGMVGTLTQARRASEQAAQAAAERDRSELVSNLMLDMFRLGDPGYVEGATVTAREVLDRGTARIRIDFADEPELQADLLTEVAQIYDNLGLFQEAAEHFERALELRRQELGDEAPLTAASFTRLAHVRSDQGRADESIELAGNAVAILSAARPTDAVRGALAEARSALGLGYAILGQSDSAAVHFTQSVSLLEQADEPDQTAIAHTLFAWAGAAHGRGEFQRSDSLYRQTIERYEQAGLDMHPDVSTSLQNLGTIRTFMGQAAEAEELLGRALEMRRVLYGDYHPATAETLTGLASTLAFLERYDEAVEMGEEALVVADSVWGPAHISAANTRLVLGGIIVDRGGDPRALQLLQEAGEVLGREFGPGNPRTISNELNIAQYYRGVGQTEEARAHFLRTLGTVDRELGEDHAYHAFIEIELARLAFNGDRLSEATRRAADALDLCLRVLRPEHRFTVAARQALARAHIEAGRFGEADSVLAPLNEGVSDPGPALSGSGARTWVANAMLAWERDDAEGTREWAQRAVDELESGASPASITLAEARSLLGAAQSLLGAGDGGVALMRQGLEALEASVTPRVPQVRAAQARLRQALAGG